MKTTKLIAFIYCILCSATSLFAMHETQSMNELSALENVDKETVFETIAKPTKSTKTPKHRYSPRTSSPLARPTSASDIAVDHISNETASEPTRPTSVRSNRYSPRTPSPLAHSISASDIAVDDISDEIPSELMSDTTQLLLIPQPARPTQTRSHRHSRKTFSPLSHSTSPSNISDMPDTTVSESVVRSAGLPIFMSVINDFPKALTLQTTHTPIGSDPNLLQLISEQEIQPGSNEIKGLFRLKKYGRGVDEVAHTLISIKFIDPTTDIVLREITGHELRDSNMFFGVTLQPTSAHLPPRPAISIRRSPYHVSPAGTPSRTNTPPADLSILPTNLPSDE